jgi:ATP-dependent RNA helicase DDX31/DBP7
MEVNFVALEASQATAGVLSDENLRSKGSWKARRVEALKKRGPKQRKTSWTLGQPKTGRTARIVQDEFASGVPSESTPSTDNADDKLVGRTGPVMQTHKRQLSDDEHSAAKKVRRLSETDIGSTAALTGKPVLMRERATGNSPDVAKLDAKTVAATMGVVGRKSKMNDCHQNDDVTVGGQRDAKETTEEVVGDNVFAEDSFESIGLYVSVAKHLELRLGIDRPTIIQEKVLRTLLSADVPLDVLVRSETGSGKTLAYCLPIAHYLLNRPKRITREDGSVAIIVVPTRELAEQVEDVATRLFRPWHWIVVGSVRGGENKKHEKDRLRKGISVLVATPGRLLDHIRNTRRFGYAYCEFLVLDEADRLLDLGFEADIKECIKSIDAARSSDGTSRRSNLLLSATLNSDVQRLAEFSLEKPVEVSLHASKEQAGHNRDRLESFSMPGRLRQHVCIVDQRHRLVTLLAFLRLRALQRLESNPRKSLNLDGDDLEADSQQPECKIMVFFSSCDSVDFHGALLEVLTQPKELDVSKDGAHAKKLIPLSIFHIHGSRSQKERIEAIRGFRLSRRAVLLCTDVAARGLDLKGVTFTIQYDPPTGGNGEELEYLHRAGRTARIGGHGDALIFLLPSEKRYVSKLESRGASMVEISGNAALAALVAKANLSNSDSLSYSARLATSCLQEMLESIVSKKDALKSSACSGFRAYCRAYATHARDVRNYFHVRNLHLGHVARSFGITDKPAEIADLLQASSKQSRGEKAVTASVLSKWDGHADKGDIARAIAEGTKQPYNDQQTSLARRRREGGRGVEAFKELASEFDS